MVRWSGWAWHSYWRSGRTDRIRTAWSVHPTKGRVAAQPAADVPPELRVLSEQAPRAAAATGPVQIDLLTASPTGLPNAIRVRVLQADRQAIRQIDNMYVSMPLNLAQRLVFGPDEHAVSAVVVQLRHTDDLGRAGPGP